MTKVLSIENVGKEYRLGSMGARSFRDEIFRWSRGRQAVNRSATPAEEAASIWALRNVGFHVEQGEALGIIGRNGAGKSTLLKILSRITAPTEGIIKVKGRLASLLEVGTGFHPELTGRENILLNGMILGMTRQEINRKFDEIVDFSGVEQFIETPVKRYSSGMYVRLAFAVAAHLEPEILVVDEVLAVGDIQFQQKCLGKMGNVAHEGRTVLFVSHNLNAVKRLCPRCVLLNQGMVTAIGSANDIIDKYMEDTFKSEGEYTQAENKNKPINLRKVSILNNKGKGASEVEYKNEFSILLEYEVHEPVENCIVWVDIRTHDEIHVLGTSDYDLNPSMLDARRPGYYRTVVNIPPKLLNRGSYYIVAGITKEAPIVVSYDRVDACNFSVIDLSPYVLQEGSTRGGVFRPMLAWNVDKIK